MRRCWGAEVGARSVCDVESVALFGKAPTVDFVTRGETLQVVSFAHAPSPHSLTPHPVLTLPLRRLIPFAPRLGCVFSLAPLLDAPSSLRKFWGVSILVRVFLFFLFPSSFLLTVSLFSAGTWDPLSLANARAGCAPFFSRARCALLPLTNARRFVFFLLFLFLFADRPALLFAPSPRVAPPLAAPRHASPLAMRRASPRVAPRHASRVPLSCRPLATRLLFATRRVAPPSRAPLVASRRAFVTRRPSSRVALCHVLAFTTRRALLYASPVASILLASPCHVATLGLDLRWRWCGWAGGLGGVCMRVWAV